MMTENNLYYDTYKPARNPKVLKNPKGYDRVKDRKDKQLYDYEYDTKEEEFLNENEQDP
jgi:hypothetical protein